MRTSGSHLPLFAAWVVTAAALIGGIGLALWNWPLLRERADIHALLRPHRVDISLAMMMDQRKATPAEIEQVRGAYAFPDRINLANISWNLVNRPTPFVGAMPQPGVQNRVRFNRQQFRNAEDVVTPKPAGVFRIFVTGGSFAFSIGAPSDAETICAFLEQKLNRDHGAGGRKFEVWCGAVPAWCSTHERIEIENRIRPLEPDLTIMLTGVNDCHWGYVGENAEDMRTYAEDEFFSLINETLKIDGLSPYPLDPPTAGAKPVAAGIVGERFAFNVRQAATALAGTSSTLLVAMQPYLSERAKTLTPVEKNWVTNAEGAPKTAYIDECYAAMEKDVQVLLAEAGTSGNARQGAWKPAELRFASLTDVFKERADPIFFDLYHVGDKGNGIVAERLEKVLEGEKLLP